MSRASAVLVTGCSSGIGRATAERLARGGWTVYASARRLESMSGLEAAGCRLLRLDVTDEASMRAAVEEVERAEGAVGALVNNAGYSLSGAVESISLEDARRQFETKHAVEALSDALRFEVQSFGIDVVVIEPGLIRTDFAETAVGSIPVGEEPYGRFNAAVGAATAGAYDGFYGRRLGGGPDAVARTIERALAAKRPRTRYRVTPSAKLFLTVRRLLPDRGWDALVGRTYPKP